MGEHLFTMYCGTPPINLLVILYKLYIMLNDKMEKKNLPQKYLYHVKFVFGLKKKKERKATWNVRVGEFYEWGFFFLFFSFKDLLRFWVCLEIHWDRISLPRTQTLGARTSCPLVQVCPLSSVFRLSCLLIHSSWRFLFSLYAVTRCASSLCDFQFFF